MEENFDTFNDFVMQYDMSEDMIVYKFNHTYRTVHQAEEIARSLNLTEEDKELATIIALLHDVARFRQWTEYKTFTDAKSFDHGDEGVKILFDEGEIEKYNIDKKYYDIIKTAVRLHNKLDINEEELSAKELLHTKIIRDADKIDIIYSFSTQRLLEIKSDDSKLSEKVINDFNNHKQVNKLDINNINDKIISILALTYDLNYKYSLKRIYEEEYYNKMIESFHNVEVFKPYVEEVHKFIKGEIEDVREEIQS